MVNVYSLLYHFHKKEPFSEGNISYSLKHNYCISTPSNHPIYFLSDNGWISKYSDQMDLGIIVNLETNTCS